MEIYHGTMTARNYMELLEERFEPVAADIMGDFWILQHDGATCHTAKAVTTLLDQMEIETLDWPPRSPDLSPIENVWAILKKNVYKRNPQTIVDLEDYIFEEWDKLDGSLTLDPIHAFGWVFSLVDPVLSFSIPAMYLQRDDGYAIKDYTPVAFS